MAFARPAWPTGACARADLAGRSARVATTGDYAPSELAAILRAHIMDLVGTYHGAGFAGGRSSTRHYRIPGRFATRFGGWPSRTALHLGQHSARRRRPTSPLSSISPMYDMTARTPSRPSSSSSSCPRCAVKGLPCMVSACSWRRSVRPVQTGCPSSTGRRPQSGSTCGASPRWVWRWRLRR